MGTHGLKYISLALGMLICFPSWAFLPCDRYLGPDRPGPSLWPLIEKHKSNEGAQIAIEFFRHLSEMPARTNLKLPLDLIPSDLKTVDTVSYPNAEAVRWIMEILKHFRQPIFVDNIGVGYIKNYSRRIEIDSDLVDLVLYDDSPNSSERPFKLDMLKARRGYHPLQLAGPLIQPLKEAFSGKSERAFRTMTHVRQPELAKSIDDLDRSGRTALPASGVVQFETLNLLSSIGLNLQIHQGRERKIGRLLHIIENPSEYPSKRIHGVPYDIKEIQVRLLRQDAHQKRDCESRFDVYSRPRRGFRPHEIVERQEYLHLIYKCTESITIRADDSVHISIW